jgi:hypothetical protein
MRVGIIRITRYVIDDHPEDVHLLFSKAIPIDIWPSQTLADTLEYKCLCSQFDEVKEGERIPYYTAELTWVDGGPKTVRFLKE